MPTLTYRKSCLLKGHSDSIVAMDFSPSGSMLTTADIDGKLFIWSRNTGKLLYETVVSQKGGFTSTAWLKNDAILAGTSDGQVFLITLTSKNNRDVTWLPLFDHEVECIATHRNGLIAASALDKILIFNIVTKGTTRSCKMKNELVHKNMDSKLPENVIVSSIHWANSISPHALLATYLDHGIILWDTDSGSKLRNISILARAGDATLSPDHRFVALSNLETGFDVYECDTFKAVKTLDCELSVKKQRTCLPIKFIRGGEFLLGGSSFGRPAVYRLDMEGPVELLIHEDGPVIVSTAEHFDRLKGRSCIACGTTFLPNGPYVQLWEGVSPHRPDTNIAKALYIVLLALSVFILWFLFGRPDESTVWDWEQTL